MAKKILNPKTAPQPIGPYNQCVIVNGFIYTAGQIALDPTTGNLVAGDVSSQTRQVLVNLKNILEGADTSLDKVVKTTVFLKNLDDFAAMNNVYGEFFPPDIAPARSTIEVARLPKDAVVEIEAVATL